MRRLAVLLLCACCVPAQAADLLIRHARIVDGTGRAAYTGDVRVRGNQITAVAKRLKPEPGEVVRDARGLVLAPGFIDMHSHADGGLLEDLNAATQTRQGITTIVVGQDGYHTYPLADWFGKLDATPPALNVASMVGHATVRGKIMGLGLFRASTAEEQERMKAVLTSELQAGAFGMSTGLEYEDAHFSTTEEVVELSKVAASRGGFYISHVRDEADKVFDSYDEVLRIGREARLPVQITHIKLGSVGTWHLAAKRMPAYFEQAAREGIDLRADVYPYTYWHSTIRVLIPDRQFFNPEKVAAGLAAVGGGSTIRLTHYTPDPKLGGKTLAEIAAIWGVTEVDAYMRLVKETMAEVTSDVDMESIIGTTMSEDDVRWFVAHPKIMFCSDGALHGSHPRGAGTFPRILGHYVREQKVLTLELAIHKMTGLPASSLGLKDRGRIAPGMIADLVLFDPKTVIDNSTVQNPQAPPTGIVAVMNAGDWVMEGNTPTGKRPGKVLRAAAVTGSAR